MVKLNDMKLRVRRTSHLTLRCKDLGKSQEFYQDMLNLFAAGEDETGRVYLAGDRDTLRPVLALEQAADADAPLPTPKKMYGLEHFSIETGSFQQLQAIYRRFKENGVTIDHTMDHGITNSVYFLDPDGNLIEVYYDVPRAEYPEPVYPFASYGPIDDRLAKTD